MTDEIKDEPETTINYAYAKLFDMETDEYVGVAFFDVLDDDNDNILAAWSMVIPNAETVTAQHIHIDDNGLPGVVAIPLTSTEHSADNENNFVEFYGKIETDPFENNPYYSSVQDLLSKGAFFMVHTSKRPAGAYVGKLEKAEDDTDLETVGTEL